MRLNGGFDPIFLQLHHPGLNCVAQLSEAGQSSPQKDIPMSASSKPPASVEDAQTKALLSISAVSDRVSTEEVTGRNVWEV